MGYPKNSVAESFDLFVIFVCFVFLFSQVGLDGLTKNTYTIAVPLKVLNHFHLTFFSYKVQLKIIN